MVRMRHHKRLANEFNPAFGHTVWCRLFTGQVEKHIFLSIDWGRKGWDYMDSSKEPQHNVAHQTEKLHPTESCKILFQLATD